jgi:hypothetical protein
MPLPLYTLISPIVSRSPSMRYGTSVPKNVKRMKKDGIV